MTGDPGASVLRSQLVYRCGSDLQNMTVVDVEEMKWPTKKMVFGTLLGLSPALVSTFDEAMALQNDRDREQKRMQKASCTREERLEAEKVFRSRFTTLVVRALEKLGFPPALKPFADITSDLFHEPGVVRAAMDFILVVGAPDTQAFRPRTPREGREGGDGQDGGSGGGGHYLGRTGRPPATPEGSAPTQRRGNPGAGPSPGSREGSNTPRSSRGSPLRDAPPQAPPAPSSATRASSSSSSSSARVPPGVPGSGGGGMDLSDSMHRLQRQNEFLSRQVRRLLSTQRNRELSESRLENITRELSSTLAQLAGEAVGIRKGKGKSIKEAPAAASVSAEEDAAFRAEVARREKAVEHPLGAKDVKDAGTSTAEVGASLSAKKGKGGSAGSGSGSGSGSAMSGDQRLMWGAVKASVDGLLQQWVEARRDAQRHCMVRLERQDSFAADFTRPAGGSTLLLRDVLGVKTPLAGREAAETWAHGVGGDSVALDLQRVHGLQRDLVGLAQAAFSTAEALAGADGEGAATDTKSRAHAQVWSPGDKGGDALLRRSVESLRHHATALLLDTSSFAPVAPLAAAHPLSSSCSGLDSIDQELTALGSAMKGGLSPTLQRALDRARVEQTNLCRALHLTRTVLTQWPVAADKARNRLGLLGEQARQAAHAATKSLSRFTEGSAAVAEALRSIQTDRAAAAQLGQLGKGGMGPRVAALVQALEVYGVDLDALPLELLAVKRRVAAAFELEAAAVDAADAALLVAGSRTHGLASRTGVPDGDRRAEGISAGRRGPSGRGRRQTADGESASPGKGGGARPGSGKRPGSAGTRVEQQNTEHDKPQWID